MKKLDKLVLKAFFGPFFLTFAVVIFIFLMRLILTYFTDLFGKDLGADVYAELFFYCAIITIPLALPLAMLLSSLMTFGKLGEFFELTAIKSAGISVARAMRPVLIVAMFVTGFAFWFNNIALPWANLKFYRLLYDIKTTKTTLNIKEGIFYNDLPGYSIKVMKKYPDGKTLKNVIIYDHTQNDGNKHVTLADSALMYVIMNKQYLVFELFNGNDYLDDADKTGGADQTDFATHGFRKSKVVMSLQAFDMHKTEEDQFKHHQIMMNIYELSHDLDSMKTTMKDVRKSMFLSSRSYFTYFLKDSQMPLDSIQKRLIKDDKKWIEKVLVKKKVTSSNPYQSLDYALNQARNMISFSEANQATFTSKNEDMFKTNLEWHHKFSNAIAVFVMFLIGAPLGAIIKKGGFGMPVVLAISFFILMYVMTQQGDKMAKEGKAVSYTHLRAHETM
jgi:lipopolysaccharide export system permease protein